MGFLADLIAKKKQEQPIQEEEIEAEESYLPASSYHLPDPALFIAAWTPFLRSPYNTDVLGERRLYLRWLLSPTCHVIGTFSLCDEHLFFAAFMKHNPPKNPYHLHQLWILLSDIKMFVPESYQREFLNIIEGIEEEKIPV